MKEATIVFPIADGVEDLEYYVTRMRLEEAGFRVLSAGITKDDVIGKNGLVISVDVILSELRADDLVDDLVNAGAIWVDESAFTEGNLVWGRVVADIPNFCRELVAAFTR